MSDSKIQIKVGIIEFSGEGNQDWLATQLDKILERAPELLKIELENPKVQQVVKDIIIPSSIDKNDVLKPSNLSIFLKEKNATVAQVKKFLTTAAFIQLNGKTRITTSDVNSALKAANQSKLNNASDCLAQNVKKGFCEKDGSSGFFVTTDGLSDLGISQ
jgi:hypothetical protein